MKQKALCILSMTLAILYCIGLIAIACGQSNSADVQAASLAKQETGRSMGYEDRIFDQEIVHTLDVQIDASDWQNLKNHAIEKNYHDCDVVVDGEKFSHVGVRTKGNSTLVQSIVRGWDRQSLVLNFGAFNKSQRYYGLDKLALYNNACDSSFLRDMLCYDMMRQMGVPTPLCSYVAVYLNGEYVGLHVAMESVDTSFAVRNFGYDYGLLYKPEQFDVAAILTGTTDSDVRINVSALAGENGSIEISDFLEIPDDAVALKYLGDSLDSYQEIWDKSVFKIGTSDKHRLVESLKNISEGTNLEESVDMEELARYFAVNTFVLNTDGYATEMAHNYYLYEKDGQLSMLPWDYDQTLGTVGAVGDSGDMTEFVNLAIDTPVLNVSVEERPMLAAVLGDENGLRLYHEALQELLDAYVYSGYLDDFIARNTALIRSWVESDPTSGVSAEQFEAAVRSVSEFCDLRTESIQRQLDGKMPRTTEAQRLAPETLVDASGYTNPNSGSFAEMIMPEGSGIYLEDALRSLRGQLNFTAIAGMLPIDSVLALEENEDENGTAHKLIEAGLVGDPDDFEREVKITVLPLFCNIGMVIFTLIVLVAGFIFINHAGKRHQPAARREGKRHAV